MKRIIAIILLLMLLCGCTAPMSEKPPQSVDEVSSEIDYVKAVWITYYELQSLMSQNESKFRDEINEAFKRIKNLGFNTVCVQVRPCADAFYYSKYFPTSKYCFGRQGSELSFDPLKVMCEIANEKGLRLEAWINPYRVSQDNKINELSENNIARIWHDGKKTKSYVYVTNKGIYFNPAVDDVTQLIVNGVKEIVENYSISAIHFDDYFYPTTSEKIDKKQYAEYKRKKGKMSLAEFRRSRVSQMVKSVYSAIKSINSSVKFGISPASNIKNDYSVLYADVEKWVSESGYVDYICPQVYFGFKNVYQPFMFTVKKWSYITECDLYIGLPLYKADRADKYSAKYDKSIINEFKNNDNIISRQIKYLAKIDEVKGFYVFSYGCLLEERCSAEVENMASAMQNSNPH